MFYIIIVIKTDNKGFKAMKRISERLIAKQFLQNLSENYCEDNNQGNHLKTQNGIVSKDELYNHFDLNNDGTVTPEDYANHIEFLKLLK